MDTIKMSNNQDIKINDLYKNIVTNNVVKVIDIGRNIEIKDNNDVVIFKNVLNYEDNKNGDEKIIIGSEIYVCSRKTFLKKCVKLPSITQKNYKSSCEHGYDEYMNNIKNYIKKYFVVEK